MTRPVPLLACLAVLVVASTARRAEAQPPDAPPLPTLVPRRAAIDTESEGLVRLASRGSTGIATGGSGYVLGIGRSPRSTR